MATYSSNTTIKVGSSIAQVASSGGSFSYTVPTGSYAMVTSISIASGGFGNGTVTITAPNGHAVYSHTESSGSQFDNFSSTPLYLPSGTTIIGTTGTFASVSVNGILFQNTP